MNAVYQLVIVYAEFDKLDAKMLSDETVACKVSSVLLRVVSKYTEWNCCCHLS
jgi:hypothetical protein